MATKEDAATGWELYKESLYSLSLDEINNALLDQGRSPIAPRTYSHYRKLHRYLYENYLPINQLDVKTLADPIWDRATRSRYLPIPVDEPVNIRFLLDNSVNELRGLATAVSEGEATIKLKVGEDDLPRALSAKDPIVEIVFRDGSNIRIGEISRFWVEGKQRLVILKVQFIDPATLDGILNKPLAQSETVSLELGRADDGRQFSDLMRTMYWTFQTLETSRIFANEVLLTLDRDPNIYIPAPRVSRMTLQSPLFLEIAVATPVLGVVTVLIGRVLSWRLKWHEGTNKKYEGKVNRETLQRLEWERHKREDADFLNVQELVETLQGLLPNEFKGNVPADLSGRADRLETIVRKQLGPAAMKLAEETDGKIVLEPQGESTQMVQFSEDEEPDGE